MVSTANLTRAETAARAGAVTVRSYRVELDLSSAPDHSRPDFPTVTTVEFDASAEVTWLDFLGSSVESVTVNGEPADVEFDGARIAVRGMAASNTVTVRGTGVYSRSGEGLHRFLDPVDGRTYLYTQYEPADARRVFACFEQPNMKAPFTFTVTAPDGWQVISNRSAATRSADGVVQTVEFSPTLPIATYLTAIAAGPYHRVESSWSRGDLTVPLGVLCRASLAEHLDADTITRVTVQGLDFFHDTFDFPYPWEKYDQVFVPEYNLGAMENPGCVTFTEQYVFRGAATAAQYEARATTILHEMAHMWFGDLVTMVWWDDLWLKESFADYMGALACAEATEWSDAWVAFANRRKAWAYSQDQLPTTHPIVADIVDLEAAKLNFDGITYAKGASVLKQLAAHVGRDAFVAAARSYFREHAYGNTTLADLLAALSAASGRDLESWASAWLQTTGMSTLTLERRGKRYEVVQTDPRPHTLGIGLYDFDESGSLVLAERLSVDITAARTPVTLTETPLVLLNDGDQTYAKVRLGGFSVRTVEASLDRIVDPLARGLVWSALWNATRDGDLAPERYLRMACAFAPVESNTALLAGVLANAAYAIGHYLRAGDRSQWQRDWLETCWNAMTSAEPASGTQLAWARAAAAAGTVCDTRAQAIRELLDGAVPAPTGLSLDPDLRWMLWTALAATGHAVAADLDIELTFDATASGRAAHLRALAARPDADVKAAVWESALTDTTLTNEHLDATIAGFRAGDRRDLIGAHDDAYFAAITGIWTGRSIEIARRIVVGLFPAPDALGAVDGWLAANPDAPAALRRLVVEQRDHLARDLRVRSR